MLKAIANFITKLQSSDETTKKRWLIILSSVAMVIVVGLWVVYFNMTFPRTETITAAENNAASSNVRVSLKNIKDTLQNGLKAIQDKSQKTFIIDGKAE